MAELSEACLTVRPYNSIYLSVHHQFYFGFGGMNVSNACRVHGNMQEDEGKDHAEELFKCIHHGMIEVASLWNGYW